MGNHFIHHNPLQWRLISCFFLLFLLNGLYGQGNVVGLEAFNINRINHQQKAMLVLGGWAVTNIGSGLLLANQRSGSDKYFHQMNAYWNIVNLGIAGFGYLSAMKQDPASFGYYASADAHFGFQRILLLNAGLDVGYIMGGLYLTERSRRFIVRDPKKADQLKGFGQSIMLQGGLLLLFDLANHFISAGNNEQLRLLINEHGAGLSWTF